MHVTLDGQQGINFGIKVRAPLLIEFPNIHKRNVVSITNNDNSILPCLRPALLKR